jgi:tRNA(Ser,Leu) C12 N-acetylase TAN1
LGMLGDENPAVRTSGARGIICVRTSLSSREVIRALRRLFDRDPLLFQYTLKWVPIDLWALSDIESMKAATKKLSTRIIVGEKWRMTVEKRRYTQHHKIEIIRELAQLIQAKVDLEKPDKILRVDIIGKYAGLSILRPSDVFSLAKPYVRI